MSSKLDLTSVVKKQIENTKILSRVSFFLNLREADCASNHP